VHRSPWSLAVKRLSIEVSDALHKQAKLIAMVQGQTLSSLVTDLLSAYLEEQAGGAAHPRRRMSDYPSTSSAPHPARSAVRS